MDRFPTLFEVRDRSAELRAAEGSATRQSNACNHDLATTVKVVAASSVATAYFGALPVVAGAGLTLLGCRFLESR